MQIENDLKQRSGGQCELCQSTESLSVHALPPDQAETLDNSIFICKHCKQQIEASQPLDANHWRCLNDSMWSGVPAVQVMAWRLLNRLKDEVWPLELLDRLYLDDDTLKWAQATGEGESNDGIQHRDGHGATLSAGDTVTLIKDLNVKGAGFTAKRGTAVRGISLVADHPDQIEGRVNGQQIVILTQFVKKAH